MDRRVDRTNEALVRAVRSLLVTHAWSDVSVRLICDTADVSRSAFYAHFDDKQDLLDKAFEALREGLGADVDGRGLDAFGRFVFLPVLMAHMESHLTLFGRNDASPSGITLYRQFKAVVAAAARDEVGRSESWGAVPDDHVTFVVGGIFAVLERWCGSGCETPAATVLEALDRYVESALHAGGRVAGAVEARALSPRR